MKASVEHVQLQYAFTERRACRLLLVPVSSFRYQPKHSDDGVRARLVELAAKSFAMAIAVYMYCLSARASTSTTNAYTESIVKRVLRCVAKSASTA